MFEFIIGLSIISTISISNSVFIHFKLPEQNITLGLRGSIEMKKESSILKFTIIDNVTDNKGQYIDKNLTLSFAFVTNKTENYSMTLVFGKSDTTYTLYSISVNSSVDTASTSGFPAGEYVLYSQNLSAIVPVANSYVCDTYQSIGMVGMGTDKPGTVTGVLNIGSFQFNPNANESSNHPVTHCEADYTVNVVIPLAVGGALSAIIVIILITFIIIRSRAAAARQSYSPIAEDN